MEKMYFEHLNIRDIVYEVTEDSISEEMVKSIGEWNGRIKIHFFSSVINSIPKERDNIRSGNKFYFISKEAAANKYKEILTQKIQSMASILEKFVTK